VNTHSINATELNGSIEIWSDDGSADLVLQADGELAIGLGLQGTADIVATTALIPSLQLITSGSASVVLTLDGEALYGRAAIGSATVTITADGDGTRWTFGESAMAVAWSFDGEGQVVPPISSSFDVVWSAELDAVVAVVQQGVGDLSLVLTAGLDEKVAKSVGLAGEAQLIMGMAASAYAIIQAPSGQASFVFDASGSARFGEKVYGEGAAAIETSVRGDLESRHYVYAEGSVDLAILLVAEKHGIPTIPGYYVEAPVMRALRVTEEARRFTVPAERRI
jgi:hypothetical protein